MIKRYLKLALGLGGLAGLNAPAQIPGKADEKIALPSFTVSTNLDRSYTANDSLSVSRISVSLLETPQSVVVLNRELVDDIAAGRTFDAVKYVAGVTAGNVNYAQDRATLRGLVATDNYVDGVLMLFGETNADPVLIERIEVIKGPAPILFANGPAAGLINKVSKSPLAEARNSAKMTVGSFDANRAEFDLTGPLTADKKLLYRLVAVRQDSDGFYDRTYTKRWVFAPMVTYRFSATSEVTLKYDTTETAFGSYNGLPLDRLTRQIIAVDPKMNYADPTNFRTDRLSRLSLAGTTQITNWLGARLALTGAWVGVDREESRVGGRAATGVTGQAAEFFGTLPVTGDRTTLLRNSQYFKRESLGLTLQNDYVARYRTGPLEHTTLTGFEWRHGDWSRLGTALVYDSINPFGALPATIPARGAVNQRFDEVSADRKFYALQEVGLLERRVLLSGGVTRNFNRFRALNTLVATNTPTYRRAQATTWQGGIVGKVSSNVSLFGGYNESFQQFGYGRTAVAQSRGEADRDRREGEALAGSGAGDGGVVRHRGEHVAGSAAGAADRCGGFRHADLARSRCRCRGVAQPELGCDRECGAVRPEGQHDGDVSQRLRNDGERVGATGVARRCGQRARDGRGGELPELA